MSTVSAGATRSLGMFFFEKKEPKNFCLFRIRVFPQRQEK